MQKVAISLGFGISRTGPIGAPIRPPSQKSGETVSFHDKLSGQACPQRSVDPKKLQNRWPCTSKSKWTPNRFAQTDLPLTEMSWWVSSAFRLNLDYSRMARVTPWWLWKWIFRKTTMFTPTKNIEKDLAKRSNSVFWQVLDLIFQKHPKFSKSVQ